MPQCSQKLQAKITEYFGECASDAEVISYLRSQGLEHTNKFVWLIPPDKFIDSKILNCLYYLVDEWDFDIKWEGTV